MKIIKTEIKDLLVIEPKIFRDQRGYFYEGYNKDTYFRNGIKANFIQDNYSFSNKGTLRGLHYQIGNYSQAKLVQVLSGKVIDIAVDLREGSSTFGKWSSIELSGDNRRQFFIPRGFAHGFFVVSETAEFFYKCDNLYNPSSERSIKFDDPELDIDWRVDEFLNDRSALLISEKDLIAPRYRDAEIDF